MRASMTLYLAGWRIAGDVCVAPVFCAGEPSGRYWVALSTNDDKDTLTMCGGSSLQGIQSVIRSPNLPVSFKPSRIRIDFKVKFLTNENTSTDLGTDLLTVRLLTMAGPVVVAAFDDSGASPGSKNLMIRVMILFGRANVQEIGNMKRVCYRYRTIVHFDGSVRSTNG